MIQFNNHNISAIEYNGHTIKKVYGACSNSPVWEYSEPVPPSTDGKFQYTNSGTTRTIACNSSPSLTYVEIIQDMYNMDRNAHISGMTDGIVGDCVTTIGESCFEMCTNLTSLTISSSVTTIEHQAFNNCPLPTLIIPSGVTVIPEYMCENCIYLSNTNIPSGVTSIGMLAYYDCLSLLNITIPASVTSIGDDAFRAQNWVSEPKKTMLLNMAANRRVTVLATTPPTLGTGVFSIQTGEPEDIASYPIYVPAESLNAYKTATNWSVYANRIFPIE